MTEYELFCQEQHARHLMDVVNKQSTERLNQRVAVLEAALSAKQERIGELERKNAQLLEALKLLLRYTESCEALLNCKPAGQVEIARATIATVESLK